MSPPGQVIAEMSPRHRAEEFRRFLHLIDASVPAHLDVHVVLDNSSTTRHRRSSAGSSAIPRFTLHLTPTYSSWLNLVERWFAELTSKWIKRSAHRSVRDLVASIRTWITNWNDEPKPYIWHKTADQILDNLAAYCQRINDSGHSSNWFTCGGAREKVSSSRLERSSLSLAERDMVREGAVDCPVAGRQPQCRLEPHDVGARLEHRNVEELPSGG